MILAIGIVILAIGLLQNVELWCIINIQSISEYKLNKIMMRLGRKIWKKINSFKSVANIIILNIG